MKICGLVALSLLSMSGYAQKAAELTPLEITDPDLPGGTYDLKMELQKKIKEAEDLTLSPAQTDSIKSIYLERQRVLASPYVNTATPVTRSLNIKFSSGLTPPVVRLSSNMLTTLVFTDAAGSPWEIESVALNRSLFSDGSDINQVAVSPTAQDAPQPSRTRNFLTIEPLNSYAYGNVAVTLRGLDTPVIFMLATGQNEVDVRVDARISGINPAQKLTQAQNCLTGCFSKELDDLTLMFVDGTPPAGAQPLKASSSEVEAWEYGESLVVRTTTPLIYPSFNSSVTSSSGVTVYKFEKEVRSITLSKGSSAKTIHLEQE